MALEPQWCETASGRPSFDVWDGSNELLVEVVNVAAATLGFELVMPPLPGLDMVIGRLSKHGCTIHIGRDIWSGMFVYADDESGDPFVREIAAWFEANRADLERRFG